MTNTTPKFSHLHVHSHYSTYDGIAQIPALVGKAISLSMPAIALTDHGNMEGVMELFTCCKRINHQREKEGLLPIKPIAGCEVYYGQNAYHLVLLAKNLIGYHNLCKIVSSGYQQKNYYRHKPHIDFSLLEQLHEGIICGSACIGGEIAQLILEAQSANPRHPDYKQAEEAFCRLTNIFGDDFYIEIQRSKTLKRNGDKETYLLQKKVNPVLIAMADEHRIPVIATNDSHFVNEDEADAQDCKMCIVGNKRIDDLQRIRFTRQEWFKSPEEMTKLFADMPEVLSNTQKIVDKIEWYDIAAEPQVPDYPVKDFYKSSYYYLVDMVEIGANQRYRGHFTPAVDERIKYELKVIKEQNLSNYFLILHDVISTAQILGIKVSSGRGAAAGSIINYCLGITDVDPLQHGLLFERFIDPYKTTIPDIDIEMEDNRRNEIVDYIRHKYGSEHVMHIITHATLGQYDALSKIQEIGVTKNVRNIAKQLTGVSYSRGIHACGIAIARLPISELIPTACVEDKYSKKKVKVTQYDGRYIEDAGVVKLDIIGLRTLSVIQNTLHQIKEKYQQDIDLSRLPLDDAATLQLFRLGETKGVYTFEGSGIQSHLREMKPNSFQDVMALHTLYYPGRMQQIPVLCARKNSQEFITYPAPILEKYLKETYGMLIYQEQVMEIGYDIGNLSYSDADKLRKALLQQKMELIETLHLTFVAGGLNKHFDIDTLEKIWDFIKQNAATTYLKAHATCCMTLAYQCAYLKAHYCEEYMQNYDTMFNE